MDYQHTSVLLYETISYLNIRKNGIYVDGTLGGAGHSSEILKRLDRSGKLIGFDQDREAINYSEQRLKDFDNKILICTNFSNIKEELSKLNINKINGAILDLGVSSYQLDNKERGFSYIGDNPLDMRMDTSSSLSAKDVVNNYTEEELAKILFNYGEEKFSKNIARNIVKERSIEPIVSTKRLSDIIRKSIPLKTLKNNKNPEKRTFQAIRIEVNKELEILDKAIDDIINLLEEGSRICIISFHSLEDRIVKNNFKRNMNPCTCPKNIPVCVCGKKSKGIIITKKPVLPTDEEININSRSKSAKLRVFEKKEVT